MPTSNLHTYYKRSVITKYSSVVKPSLTDAVCRLNWAIDQVHDIDGEKFIDAMYDTVHVDEKWFFMTRLQRKVIGASGEKIKQRTCKSKRHLLKVMFLSAVARPRWDNSKEEWFDGRSRRSCRRDAGTPVVKTVNVTRPTFKAMLIDNVIPTIRSKWPSGESRAIKIQQDNARPHMPPSDVDIVAACKVEGWDMQVVFQPPHSPDLNVLDLGFFWAIQTLLVEKHSSSFEEIVAATEEVWTRVSPLTLNKNFVTLQSLTARHSLVLRGPEHAQIDDDDYMQFSLFDDAASVLLKGYSTPSTLLLSQSATRRHRHHARPPVPFALMDTVRQFRTAVWSTAQYNMTEMAPTTLDPTPSSWQRLPQTLYYGGSPICPFGKPKRLPGLVRILR
ncbi:hypothetical protein H257_06595 [Aphanomyces astaci]|uniref:Tc1-like transposase DDE domain-containing protein n=1 Tax=Aphanomyces astaci TaxID=112090 RepID=W4GMJ7_APHAT|nr:hypothetical protein H257_06595 [Aphanomyces astaci]ETV80254.1 hypothetical protein H257_06595 [Aphanomyces astaci]|eukprot:XP_009830178.1 hypothetical protein H257_06595 [Aphanomyces astaci]